MVGRIKAAAAVLATALTLANASPGKADLIAGLPSVTFAPNSDTGISAGNPVVMDVFVNMTAGTNGTVGAGVAGTLTFFSGDGQQFDVNVPLGTVHSFFFHSFVYAIEGSYVPSFHFVGSSFGAANAGYTMPDQTLDRVGNFDRVLIFAAPAPVPGPVVGAGFPGLALALGGLALWRRRNQAAAV